MALDIPPPPSEIVAIAPSYLNDALIAQWAVDYPELMWLADEGVQFTQEGSANSACSPSKRLFGKQFIEFDRSVMSLAALNWILEGGDGAYAAFVAPQPTATQLTRASFDELHDWITRVGDPSVIRAGLVLGDLGKSPRARAVFEQYGCCAADHDDFYVQALQAIALKPELSATYERLSPDQKGLLHRSANLAHYGHITHMEGGPEIFAGLVRADSNAIETSLLVQICDVAGAAAHLRSDGSLMYQETTHQTLMATARASRIASHDPQQAYVSLLQERASWLGFQMAQPMDWVLTRFGCMLRLTTQAQGEELLKVSQGLNESKLVQHWHQASVDMERLTPTYVPALLLNLGVADAMQIGVPFLIRAFEVEHGNLRLNFNGIAGIAKQDRQRLVTDQVIVDAEGTVRLQNKNEED